MKIMAIFVLICVSFIFTGCREENTRPYIYHDPIKRNPKRNPYVVGFDKQDTVCTKHGRLNFGERLVFSGSMKVYCQRCVYEVLEIYLDKHIGWLKVTKE